MSISPRFEALEQAIAFKDLEKVREDFKKMNSTWTINESVVRYNSIAHYGRVETAISFLPSSMETEPTDESGTWKQQLISRNKKEQPKLFSYHYLRPYFLLKRSTRPSA